MLNTFTMGLHKNKICRGCLAEDRNNHYKCLLGYKTRLIQVDGQKKRACNGYCEKPNTKDEFIKAKILTSELNFK